MKHRSNSEIFDLKEPEFVPVLTLRLVLRGPLSREQFFVTETGWQFVVQVIRFSYFVLEAFAGPNRRGNLR
jgi:hypothetical protein